jgi:hypothetical protein
LKKKERRNRSQSSKKNLKAKIKKNQDQVISKEKENPKIINLNLIQKDPLSESLKNNKNLMETKNQIMKIEADQVPSNSDLTVLKKENQELVNAKVSQPSTNISHQITKETSNLKLNMINNHINIINNDKQEEFQENMKAKAKKNITKKIKKKFNQTKINRRRVIKKKFNYKNKNDPRLKLPKYFELSNYTKNISLLEWGDVDPYHEERLKGMPYDYIC